MSDRRRDPEPLLELCPIDELLPETALRIDSIKLNQCQSQSFSVGCQLVKQTQLACLLSLILQSSDVPSVIGAIDCPCLPLLSAPKDGGHFVWIDKPRLCLWVRLLLLLGLLILLIFLAFLNAVRTF